jgi:type IV pilus assembly protein PilV
VKPLKTHQHGIILLEGLMAILIFSFGILSMVAMLAVSVKDSSSAQYRTEASLLVNQVIGQMETGDKAYAALNAAYASPSGASFVAWRDIVTARLPGAAANLPTITIGTDNTATVTVRWQSPGDSGPRNFAVVAKITG